MNTVFPELKQCSGCTACYSACPTNAITMSTDEEGFLYPVIDSDICIRCNKCRIICPINNERSMHSDCQKVYAYTHFDEKVLSKSSSGGAFTAISDFVLEHKGVVFGAIYSENLVVRHDYAQTKSERDKMCGSKYVQSELGQTFSQVRRLLEDGRVVLFSGTPCQVAGLYAFIDNQKFTGKLFTVDFLCHGVMSPLLFKEYLEFVEKSQRIKITGHDCRKKHNGWGHCESNIFADGTEDHISRFSQLHKRLFYMDVGERPSCYSCKFCTLERHSDITIGDFWGIEKFEPDMYDINGVSLVIINTIQGMNVFDEIRETGKIRQVPIDYALPKQPHLNRPIIMTKTREQFWDNYHKKGYYYAIKKLFYRPIHEGISDVLKKVGVYDTLLRLTGKE